MPKVKTFLVLILTTALPAVVVWGFQHVGFNGRSRGTTTGFARRRTPPVLSLSSGKNINNDEKGIHYTLIEDPLHFLDVCQELSQAAALAFDIECEFNRHRYGEHLCLLQLSNGKDVFIVDPTTVGKLDLLWNVLENPTVPVVCHGPSSDLALLDKLYGRRPSNLFDTELAARMLGYEKQSLSYLLETHFGEQKQSHISRANWSQRPLSQKMLDYAALDVAYLHDLREILANELEDHGRLDWHAQECQALEQIQFQPKVNPHLRLKGSRHLTNEEAHLLKHLFDVRDAVARELDKPAYHIIPNPILLDLARKPPRHMNAWKNLRGVHPHVRNRASRDFHRAVVTARASAPKPAQTNDTKEIDREEEERVKSVLGPIRAQIQQNYPDIHTMILSARTVDRIATEEIKLLDLREWQHAIVLQAANQLNQDLTDLLRDER